MKHHTTYGTAIRDIGYDHYFIYFWGNLQLQIYKDYYSKVDVPCMAFDGTGGCCRKIKRFGSNQSSNLFLYEGVMEVENITFTAL